MVAEGFVEDRIHPPEDGLKEDEVQVIAGMMVVACRKQEAVCWSLWELVVAVQVYLHSSRVPQAGEVSAQASASGRASVAAEASAREVDCPSHREVDDEQHRSSEVRRPHPT